MGGVFKKKKKSLLAKIIGKIKGEPMSFEQRDISPDVTFNDIRTDDDVSDAIASRRNELKAAKHDNSDVAVIMRTGG